MAPATKGSLGGASFRRGDLRAPDTSNTQPTHPRLQAKLSAVSATSYRSCVSHASFRSCVSSVYHECQGSPTSQKHEGFGQNNEGFHSLTGHSNEGFQSSLDNVSYYSVTDSLAADATQSLPSIAAAAPPSLSGRSISLSGADKEVEKEAASATSLYLGYVFAILAGISFTASNALLPQLPLLDPWLLLLFRSFFQLLTMSPIIACARRNPFGPPKGRWKLPIQSIIGGLLIVVIYVSISRLPPGDLACIFLTTPLLTILLSTWLLQERCGVYRSIASIIVIIGSLLLARPDGLFPRASNPRELRSSLLQFNIYGWPLDFANATSTTNQSTRSMLEVKETNQSMLEAGEVDGMDGDLELGGMDALGMLAAVSVPVISAYLLVLLRQCRQVHYSVLVAWSSLGPMVVATVGLFTLGNAKMMEGPKEWLLVIAVASLGILGNVLMTKAVSWVSPSRIVILLSVSLVASYILQISVFKLQPAWLDMGGVGVVLLAVVAVGLEDLILKRINLKWL